MNIVARAENEGSRQRVSGARRAAGVFIRNPPAARREARPSPVIEDDDDDFEQLMNSDKVKPPSPRSETPNWSTHDVSREPSEDDQMSMEGSQMSDDRASYAAGSNPYGGHQQYETRESEFRSLEEEKEYYLSKISSFNSRGVPTHRRVSIETPVDELKHEYERLKRQANSIASIKFQRRILMAFVTGAEFLNKKWNPLALKLDGWSESVMDGIEEYDSVFESLSEKYSGTAEVAPEWQLMMNVLGSAFMFHLSNTLFQSVLPSVSDISKSNPELMQNIANAMSSAMGQKAAAQQGSSMSAMGANLAMQAMDVQEQQAVMPPPAAMQPPAMPPPAAPQFSARPSAPVPTIFDPAPLQPPVSTRASDDASSDGASEVSAVSGLSDLRNVTAKRAGKRRKTAGEPAGRGIEINL